MNNTQKGALGESIAAEYLESKGMQILQRNYRAGKSEIDIIAYFAETIIFAEVKARTSDIFGIGAQAVTNRKQQMIIRGAQSYCMEHNLFDSRIRFDVIEVDLAAKCVTDHIENAFTL